MMDVPILTTLGALTLAMRAHHSDPNTEEVPSDAERSGIAITAIESARRFTGSIEVALCVRDKIEAMSVDEWWAHKFLLHPSLMGFLQHRL